MRKRHYLRRPAHRILCCLLFGLLFFSMTASAAAHQLQITIQTDNPSPLTGVGVYLFDAGNVYLGQNVTSDSSGIVEFAVTDGTYKIRADYMGYQFWSGDIPVTADVATDLDIPHQNVTVTVQGGYPTVNPIAGVPVFLFTEAGAYQNQNPITDENGLVTFSLPDKSYKMRADWMGRQFWSNPTTLQDVIIPVPMAIAQVTVTGAGLPLEGVPVYAFTDGGAS